MDVAAELKRLAGLHDKSKIDAARAEAEVESTRARATELQAECVDRFGKKPKALAAWAEEERAAVEAEVAAIAAKVKGGAEVGDDGDLEL